MPEINTPLVVELMSRAGLNQTQLVKKSGVSRAQIGRIRRGDVTTVREKTLNDLAFGLGVSPEEIELDGMLKRYLGWVKECHQEVHFRGLGLPQLSRPELINDVFVEPFAGIQEASQEQPEDCESEKKKWRKFQRTDEPALTIVRDKKRVVVIGHPGDGKTIFLKKLALDLAENQNAAIPVFFRLPVASRGFEINSKSSFLDMVISSVDEEFRPLVAEKIKSGDCYLLFDGLDEVGDEIDRGNLAKRLRGFIKAHSKNRVVITSRVIGFDDSPWVEDGFYVVGLQDFGKTQKDDFIEKWTQILHRRFGKRDKDKIRSSLNDAVFSNPRVRVLAGNPLILTILAVLNESRGGDLPRRRVDLYLKVVDVFLDTWESTKRTDNFDETADVELDSREFEWLLASIALEMQRDNRTLAPKWWLREKITKYLVKELGFAELDAKDVGARVLRYLSERTGLIEERGLNEFGFLHRTFQEYFAAIGIINESSDERSVPKLLRHHMYDPQWSEVVRLVASKVPPLVAQKLIRVVRDDPDSVGRFLKRGDLLALQCLSDGVQIPDRALVEQLFKECVSLGNSKWLGITFDFIDILNRFDGTRLGEISQRTLDSIMNTAQESLEDDEVHTLANRISPERDLEEFERTFSELNLPLLESNPNKWWRKAKQLLKSSKDDKHDATMLLIGFIIHDPDIADRAIPILKEIATGEDSDDVRSRAISALSAIDSEGDKQSFFDKIAKDKKQPKTVRASAVFAFSRSKSLDSESRQWLLTTLASKKEPLPVRIASARSLGALDDQAVIEKLRYFADDEKCAVRLRRACCWALADRLLDHPKVLDLIARLLQADSDDLRRTSSQIYISATCDEQQKIWNESNLKVAQATLMGLANPCIHALDALRAIASARFLNKALLKEEIIARAIEPIQDRIQLAFLFGSCARDEHDTESDIDLFVVGNISLKELSPILRSATDSLGRELNPVVYSPSGFVEKYQQGDPFLADVVQREKLAVLPREKTSKELKDELRAMAAVRLAPTE